MIILPPNPDPPCMKLQVVEEMWNGFDFNFFFKDKNPFPY